MKSKLAVSPDGTPQPTDDPRIDQSRSPMAGSASQDDDRLNRLMQERLEMKRRLKQREYERLAKKSFILNKADSQNNVPKASNEDAVDL